MKILALLLLTVSSAAYAAGDYVRVADGHDVYVEYSKPRAGRPTVVLVNGLVYQLSRWDDYADQLTANGVGVVKYYFRGQLSTLKREVDRAKTPEFFKDGLSLKDFTGELSQVLDQLGIRGQVTVVGLSYGAAIAADFATRHPERVERLVLMAPLVVSLDKYDGVGAWIRWNLDAIKLWWGPMWGTAAYDYYYNFIYHSYLFDQRLTPDKIPAEVKDIADAYKESIFHQVRAVRDFDLRDYKFAEIPEVHLMVADDEESLALADQYRSWQGFSAKSRATLIKIGGSSHAIPDTRGDVAAELTLGILAGQKGLGDGRIYKTDKKDGHLIPCDDLNALKADKCGN
jgi:pimeloyl-ACP methyl ester carboxylesterase